MSTLKRFGFGLVIVLAAIAVSAVPSHADAATPKTPIDSAYVSRIIDDQVFTNKNAMSAAEIQNFLNARVPNCQSGYTCLKNYHDPLDPVPGRTAAQLIYDMGQALGLNPQVILVTLQKEQSLVNDDYPYASQYQTAMGYGCPDGGSCATEYFGLYNQIRLGATALRAAQYRSCGDYSSIPGWYSWFPTELQRGQTTNGAVNPYRLDQTNTTIGTCATGALYLYTPHRVDGAWISRSYRPGIAATYYYGNYNFVTIWKGWFGSTWGDPYRAQWVSQTGGSTMIAGTAQTVTMTFKNTGNQTWTQNQVKLGTSHGLNRASQFSGGAGWLASNRIQMVESSVAPGANATFTFALSANVPPGNYAEYFQPLVEGIVWMDDWGAYYPIAVGEATHAAQLVSQQVPDMLPGGLTGTVTLRYKNVGLSTWTNSGATPTRLGTDSAQNHVSPFYTPGSWVSNNRVGLQEASVPPGGIGTFTFAVTAPSVGRYTETLNPVIDGVAWMDERVTISFETGGTYEAQWVGQSAYPLITAGQTAPVYLDYRNTGTATWYNDGAHAVDLGTDNPRDYASLAASGWLSANRAATFAGKVVNGSLVSSATIAPGETARFAFTVVGPPAGDYQEYFRLVAEGRAWFGTAGVYQHLNTVPRYGATFAGQSYPSNLTLGAGQTAWVEFRNTGNLPWEKGGANPFRLGTNRPQDYASSFYDSADWLAPNRLELDQATVNPGQVGRFTFTLKPSQAGNFNEYFRPVVEGRTWLQDWGVFFPLSVQP